MELKLRMVLIPHGLKPGDKAPDFAGYDQNGNHVQSKKILESGPMVLFFTGVNGVRYAADI